MTCASRRQENYGDLQHFISVGKHTLRLRQRHGTAAEQTQRKDRGAEQGPQPLPGAGHHDISAPGEAWTWPKFTLAERKTNAVAVVTTRQEPPASDHVGLPHFQREGL